MVTRTSPLLTALLVLALAPGQPARASPSDTADVQGRTAVGASVAAEDAAPLRGWLMLGGGVTPSYDGASDYGPAPAIAGRLEWGRRYVQISGVTARVNVLGLSHLELGPALNVALGRAGAEGTPLAALGDVATAVELGGFVATTWSDVGPRGTNLWAAAQVTQDATGAHGGWQAGATLYYAWSPSARWHLGVQAELNLASAAYHRTYFGVSAAGATASGLARYDLSTGLKDTGLTLDVSYALSGHWWLTAVGGARLLVGAAADSPVVGSAAGLVGALAVNYSFW
jgi:outer membrane scaffolding protein for murein synthesis (MipA/OmpV family)